MYCMVCVWVSGYVCVRMYVFMITLDQWRHFPFDYRNPSRLSTQLSLQLLPLSHRLSGSLCLSPSLSLTCFLLISLPTSPPPPPHYRVSNCVPAAVCCLEKLQTTASAVTSGPSVSDVAKAMLVSPLPHDMYYSYILIVDVTVTWLQKIKIYEVFHVDVKMDGFIYTYWYVCV